MLAEKKIGLALFELRRNLLASIGKHAKDIFAPLVENGYTIFTLDGRTLTAKELENLADGDYLAARNPSEYIPRLGTSSAPAM
jgi:hypothetical protein